MATKIYSSKNLELLNGMSIEMVPLKIKHLHDLMDEFENIKDVKDDMDAVDILVKCAAIAMRQYYSEAKSLEDVENLVDLHMVYEILEYAANIKVNSKDDKDVKQKTMDGEKASGWSDLDLAKLESEVFFNRNLERL